VPELYRLRTPASPRHSAELDGVRIDPDSLNVPDTGERALVIEGAGGLMVPLNHGTFYINIFERWQLPVVLCASTALGTIGIAEGDDGFCRSRGEAASGDQSP
jgi:dethiobiotin synthetase